jgi:hypothetical protein
MFKKRQVVSTKGKNEAKKGEIISITRGNLIIANCDPINIKPHYIYILSDDPIKVGDNYFFESEQETIIRRAKTIDKTKEYWLDGDIKYGIILSKIIATNDPELNKPWIRDNDPQRLDPDYIHITTMNGLPKLSDGFIQSFVEKYIKNPITEIMVEYGLTIDKSMGHFHQQRDYFLKVNPDGTITTKDEKTTWNRSEVIRLCNKAWLKNPNDPNMLENFDNWIENNL